MFSREEIIEEGIVELVEQDKVTVRIIPSGGCEGCSAKIYCSSSNNMVSAIDEFGAEKGDQVRISVPGKNISSASTFIYGIPLLLIIIGVGMGHWLFNDQKEVFSAILSFLLIALYGGIIYFSSFRKDYSSIMPRVIFISKK